MATRDLWRTWIRAHENYVPEIENAKAIGDALKDFEESLLTDNTKIYSVCASKGTRKVNSSPVDYRQLASVTRQRQLDRASHRFFFINRFLEKNDSDPRPEDAHKLQLSGEALRELASRYLVPPAFLHAISRYYFPQGRAFQRYQRENGGTFWHQWYFLPFRVQVPCTDERSHAASSTNSNQMNPFHYLHLPDENVDIRGSQIAVYICYDGNEDTITLIAFNFMHGQWSKVIKEPQRQMVETLEDKTVQDDPMYAHLVFLTTVVRWWNNALHSVNEQLIAYERRLQEEIDDETTTNAFYNATSRALHAAAAHVHRYGLELDSLEDTCSDISKAFATVYGGTAASLVGMDHVRSQLRATNAFLKEQEKKINNILALLFNRMQISNDQTMVEIMKATRQEAEFSRDTAERSQELSESMKKDSVSMKTIAILTMFFLPATSFAALLAMPFFATNEYLNDVSRVWIWVLLTVPTTGVAYAFYYFWSQREAQRQRESKSDLEKGVHTP